MSAVIAQSTLFLASIFLSPDDSKMKISMLSSKSRDYFRFVRRCWTSGQLINQSTEQSSPETSQKEECLKMLRDFRQRRLYKNELYLRKASYFCWKHNLDRQFVDVVDEWFRQARLQIFDRSGFFKATSDLCNLGKLNQKTDGDLVRNLGWSSIEYLTLRIAELGFHRFDPGDILSAMIGLDYLILIPASEADKNSSKTLHPIFLDGLRRYLEGWRPSDEHWIWVTRVMAPQLISLFSQIDPLRPPSTSLLLPLCNLSKIGFDSLAANETVDRYCARRVLWWGQAWLRWNLDPDSIAPGSKSTWYRACSIIFEASGDRVQIKDKKLLRGVVSQLELSWRKQK